MSKGLCTALKTLGFVFCGVMVIFGIYLMVTMISAIKEVSSSFNEPGIMYENFPAAITLYVFLGFIIILEGLAVLAGLFFLGSAGDYMRLKRQKEGLWGIPGQISPNPFFGFEPPPIQQPQPEPSPPEQPQPEPQPEQPQDGGAE